MNSKQGDPMVWVDPPFPADAPYGPYEPTDDLGALFLQWMRWVIHGIRLYAANNALTLQNVEHLRREPVEQMWAVLCEDAERAERLKAMGLRSAQDLHDRVLEPLERELLQMNDQGIMAAEGEGERACSSALEYYRQVLSSQIGHVSADDLQAMYDAAERDGALILASRDYREHVKLVAARLRRRGYVPLESPGLEDFLYDVAVRTAISATGPARRKHGLGAGQPRWVEDVFGFNFLRGEAMKWRKSAPLDEQTPQPDHDGPQDADDESVAADDPHEPDEGLDQAMRIIAVARQCCTPVELRRFRLKYFERKSFGQIAAAEKVSRASVSRSIGLAKAKVTEALSR